MSESLILQWWTCREGVAPDWGPLRAWLEAQPATAVRAVYAFSPGMLFFAGEPLWQIVLRAADPATEPPEPAADCRRTSAGAPAQVYREVDEAGRVARDVIRDLDAEPAAGMVLALPVFSDAGWTAPEITRDRAADLTRRIRQALPESGGVPVVDERTLDAKQDGDPG
ncbi:MAG: hypothetical protein ACOCTI_05800 [Phycisphaeraceae bacterium]